MLKQEESGENLDQTIPKLKNMRTVDRVHECEKKKSQREQANEVTGSRKHCRLHPADDLR